MNELVLADQVADWHRLKALVLDSVSSPITRGVCSLGLRSDNEFTRILRWPGYRVYQHEIDEKAKTLKLWVRRKRGNRKIERSGCGRKFVEADDIRGRPVRDLPWGEYQTTVFVEIYRVRYPDCGVKTEKVPQLPSKAPFSKRFEDAVGLACESAVARQGGGSLVCWRARCGRSTCGIWSGGRWRGAFTRRDGDHVY